MWLHCPEGEIPMPDIHYQTAARLRYNVPMPNPCGEDTCQNIVPRNGRVCGAWCRADKGAHAARCKIGGGVQQRHDNARDVFAKWMRDVGIPVQTEQAVPAWDKPGERAKLDIAYFDAQGTQRFLDLAIIASRAHASVAPDVRLERHERYKHRRYPGPALVPFVIDVRGAWGSEAQAWLKTIKPQLLVDDKNTAISVLKWRLAACIQISVADAVIRGTTDTRRPRDPPVRPNPPSFEGAPPPPLQPCL